MRPQTPLENLRFRPYVRRLFLAGDQTLEGNRRGSRRTDAFRIGSIAFGEPAVPLDCLVWDQSATGAQIELETIEGIPDRFTLIMNAYARPRLCQVVWRRERRIGVTFMI